jgi:hypothetical protein
MESIMTGDERSDVFKVWESFLCIRRKVPGSVANGKPVDGIEIWKPNLKVVRAVLRYVMDTGGLDCETGIWTT